MFLTSRTRQYTHLLLQSSNFTCTVSHQAPLHKKDSLFRSVVRPMPQAAQLSTPRSANKRSNHQTPSKRREVLVSLQDPLDVHYPCTSARPSLLLIHKLSWLSHLSSQSSIDRQDLITRKDRRATDMNRRAWKHGPFAVRQSGQC